MAVFVTDSQTDVEVDGDRLARLAAHVTTDRGVPAGMELSIICVDVDRITELNTEHMGKDGPTDVLAFPLDDPTALDDAAPLDDPASLDDEAADDLPLGLLGDVVLCPAVARDQAGDHGRDTAGEIELLLVHGILHLLGHDHAEPEEEAVMFGLTDQLLASFAETDAETESDAPSPVGGAAS